MTEPLTDQQLRALVVEAIRREDRENWTNDLGTGVGFSAGRTVATVLADAAFKAVKPELDRLRAELAQAREARLEWARTADHPELARWAESLVDADLTPHPAFAWRGTTTGYEVAAQIATTSQLTDDARHRLLAELQTVLGETVCRVLDRSPTAPACTCRAETVHQAGCPAVTSA